MDIENRQVVAKWEEIGGRDGVSRSRLANVNFYIQNGLTRSYCITKYYIQYPMINHNGKEYTYV